MAKILVVDDAPEDLATMKTILKREGHEVVTAANGASAYDKIKTNGLRLILIDIKMPTLTGYDVLRFAKEKLNHKIPILYVSIFPKQDVDLNGSDGFIQKPFAPGTFIGEIRKALKKVNV